MKDKLSIPIPQKLGSFIDRAENFANRSSDFIEKHPLAHTLVTGAIVGGLLLILGEMGDESIGR